MKHDSEKITIIAEAGVNHNGSLLRALEMVEAAAQAGADIIKFQSFKTEQMLSILAPKAAYQMQNTNHDENQWQMLKGLELDEAAQHALLLECHRQGLEFLSSPFDLGSLGYLIEELGVSRIKLASGEINNAPLLLAAARSGREIILSTGMSTLGEIEFALGVLAFGYCHPQGLPGRDDFKHSFLSSAGQHKLREKVTLMHCTSEYPAPVGEINLRAMDTLKQAFGLKVGYSDHSSGTAIAVAAAARGATMIEKHFTLDRQLPGPDHKASLEAAELQQMIGDIRQVQSALGSFMKGPSPSEWKNIEVSRKSLVAAQAIKAGEVFTENNLAIKRPGTGIAPQYYWEWLGKKAGRDYLPDELVEL
ncbi:MAG: N-acetylneuraminate synthase [Syntrophomonadaceae bacterium]|nr:N-acetylneuraminate synthase [Syntrophomonadaceae bacterium]